MKRTTNRVIYIVLPICTLLCFLLWLLKMPPASVLVEGKSGVWDLHGVDFSKTSAQLIGQPEYVAGALLTPDAFAASDAVLSGPVPDGVDFLTFRFRILLPDGGMVALAKYCAGNASRIYVNGQLLGGAGMPGETRETTTASNRYLCITCVPEGGALEIVEQTANFVHKDGDFWPALKFYIGSEQAISDWVTRFNAFPVIGIGIYLLLSLVYLLLLQTLPSYRANLWLSLLCLMWALRTGVIGTKVWLALLPWLTWEAAFRTEYLSIPATLLLLMFSYRELFPGIMQRGFRIAVYGFSTLAVIGIFAMEPQRLSHAGVPMTALSGLAAVYTLARILYVARRPNAEQRIILTGLFVVTLAIVADVLYFNTSTSGSMPGSVMETALILFSLLQMAAMLRATLRETAAAKQREIILAAEKLALLEEKQSLAQQNLTLEEKAARAEAVLQRASRNPGHVLSKGPLALDQVSGQAFLRGEDMLLSPKEFSLLCAFFAHEGEVLSKEHLYEAAWSQPMTDDANALKKAVSRLRPKLANSGFEITAKRGEGYRFGVPE